MRLIKNKKAALKFSFIILGLIIISAVILYAGGVFANTHTSTATVDPPLVGSNIDDQPFEVKVCNTGGNDINRVSIYYEYGDFKDFKDVKCKEKTGWNLNILNDPVIAGGDFCFYIAKTSGDAIQYPDCEYFYFTADTPETDCDRTLRFETRDVQDSWNRIDTVVSVDALKPVTTKTFDGPFKDDDKTYPDAEWIDGITKVVLDAVDPTPHPSGIDKIYWRNIIVSNQYCETEYSGCQTYNEHITEPWTKVINDGNEKDFSIDIQKGEESCHLLEFYAVDNVGNVEDEKRNCFFVDKTPPEVEKIVNERKVEELDLEMLNDGKAYWVTSESYSGDSSAKLVIPDNSAGTDFAGVDSFFDVFVQLDQVTSLSYYRKVVQFDNGWNPIVILGIDANGDDVFEAQPLEWQASLSIGSVNPNLLGDDSFIQCEAVTELSGIDSDFVQVDAYSNFKCYTPNVAGDGYDAYEPLSYFKSNTVGRVESTDKIAMVKVKLGGNPSTQDNEIAYVDYVELNTDVIIDEPDGFTWITSDSDIVFTCTDQLPHPSKGEELCFKVSYDEPDWHYITEDYCDFQGLEDGWCCVDATPQNPFLFNFNENEDSLHDLEYYCRDAVDKRSDVHIQYYKVDDTPPSIQKSMIGEDHIGYKNGIPNEDACPPKGPEDECYVANNEENGVHVSVVDGGEICAVDEVICDYELTWINPAGELIIVDSGEFGEEGKDIIFTKDSEHVLTITCRDALGNNMLEDVEEFLVDSTPPTTTKTYDPEAYVDGNQWKYIDTVHEVKLTAEDVKVGVDEIRYRVSGTLADSFCENCAEWMSLVRPDMGPWQTYNVPFKVGEESCHIIEYSSVDLLGNKEEIQWQCVFVDKTPPIIEKIYRGLQYPNPLTNYPHYISSQTLIDINAYDDGPHPSGVALVEYRVTLLGGNDACMDEGLCQAATGTGDWINYIQSFSIGEDSCHLIEIKAVDNVGKESEHKQCVFVENTAPEITKTIVGPKSGDCPPIPETNDVCYIDGITEIHVDVTDPTPHPVSGITCEWDYTVSDGTKTGNGQTGVTPPFDIIFPEESTHVLTITCKDALGNEVTDVETFLVDKTPPVTKKWYDSPKYSDGLVEYSFYETVDIEGSNYDLEVTVAEDGDWMVWTFDFPVEEWPEQNGNLNVGLVIATDGESEGPAFQIHNNDGTDDTYDWGTWLMSPWGPTISDGWFGWHSGDTNTLVTDLDWVEATGNRNTPHGDGVMEIKIKKSKLAGSFHWAASPTVGSGFSGISDVTMQIPPAFNWVTPIVDMGVPNYVYAEYVEIYPLWITSSTLIHLIPSDAGPHKSGIKETKYRVRTLLNPANWHYCEEGCEGWDGIPDYLEQYNPTPWNEYLGEPFSIGEESCHVIEYYSVDNVDKEEIVKRQCVFVDNTEPTPIKTVDEPKTEWNPVDVETNPFDSDATHFYPWIVDKCWSENPEEMIECWKVTLDTKIDMSCEDLGDHPVDHEQVCFQVEMDGEDITFGQSCGPRCGYTAGYCEYYSGVPEGPEGDEWCCVNHEIENFKFLEESEHNLAYYCEDALGNGGPESDNWVIDEEKFKVIGKMFRIRINDKWNLISVPFVLLNDDPEEVFEDLEGLQTVWSYDENGDWHVYRPDNPTMGDLKHIVPGEGYWLLADCDGMSCGPMEDMCQMLIVGGSLYQAGPVVPPSKELSEGWNLVGYYGTEDRWWYWGPNFPYAKDSEEAYCALYSLRNLDGGLLNPTKWSAVVGYWEPNNPHQWKEYDFCDEMDPGAGYWLSMDAEEGGNYKPETVCDMGILQELMCTFT